MTTRKDRIRARLSQAFDPEHLEVVDESHLHAGHAGARPEGETHFAVTIKVSALEGESRVAQHRAINSALAEEFDTGLHALRISIPREVSGPA